MKVKLSLQTMLGAMLLLSTGCMSFAQWQTDRRNQKEKAAYDKAVSVQLARRTPIGTWYYEEPSCSKIGMPTQVWLSLARDGCFNRLDVDRSGMFLHFWRHESGEWENLGNMHVLLKKREGSRMEEVVDLSSATNSFVEFERELKQGIQPSGRAHSSPAAVSPSSHR